MFLLFIVHPKMYHVCSKTNPPLHVKRNDPTAPIIIFFCGGQHHNKNLGHFFVEQAAQKFHFTTYPTKMLTKMIGTGGYQGWWSGNAVVLENKLDASLIMWVSRN